MPLFSWLNTDGRLLLASRVARGFAYGFLSVILGIHLKLAGLDEARIGLVITTTLVGAALATVVTSLYADRIGRRRMLVLFGALMAASGGIFYLTSDYRALFLAALIGTINVTGTELGPFLSLEQAIVPQTCTEEKRTTAFALYSMLGTLAVGAGSLFSALPTFLQGTSAQSDATPTLRGMFGLYAIIGAASLFIYRAMSGGVEVRPRINDTHAFLSPQAKGVVAKLSLLFAADSFAGGFIVQSIVSYWFFLKFGASISQLSATFFAANMLTALSYLMAARLAEKIGLVNTMVFTHIASNILLVLVPLAPSLPTAIAFYLARMSLSQMDVPTRQSYIVAVVDAGERTAATGITNLSRSMAQAMSPSISGYLLQVAAFSLPFFVAGSLKIVYDVLLYIGFRGIKPPEEIIVADY